MISVPSAMMIFSNQMELLPEVAGLPIAVMISPGTNMSSVQPRRASDNLPGPRPLDNPVFDFAVLVHHVNIKSGVGIDEFEVNDRAYDRIGRAEIVHAPERMMCLGDGSTRPNMRRAGIGARAFIRWCSMD